MAGRIRTRFLVLALATGALAGAGCHGPDLTKTLTVTPVLSGYYDDGIQQGSTHLVPQLTFKIKDTGNDRVAAGVRVTVSFWFAGDTDGENDDIVLRGLENSLTPGAETDALTARAAHGFNLAGARSDFFQHSLFKDMTAKVFVQSGGTIYRLGEFPIDRQIIPHATSRLRLPNPAQNTFGHP
jgi:hypothetical protein